MSPKPSKVQCWKGKDSGVPFAAGIPETVPHARTVSALFKVMDCCTRCELAAGRTQVVHGAGNVEAKLMLIGEAPGEKEDLAGRPFVGRGGQLLDKILAAAGLERSELYITNMVACRPPKNRPPKASEVEAHAPWIEEQLKLVQPQLIVTLGRVALTYFIPKAKVTQMRGKPQVVVHGDRTFTILPTLHPAAVLRDPELRPSLEADLRKAASLLKRRR